MEGTQNKITKSNTGGAKHDARDRNLFGSIARTRGSEAARRRARFRMQAFMFEGVVVLGGGEVFWRVSRVGW